MKEYDKSSLIGFALIILIWILFNTFFFENNIKEEITTRDNKIESSINTSNNATIKNSISSNNTLTEINNVFNTTSTDSLFEILENEKIKLTINNKGGQITSVILKEFKTYEGKPLDLFSKNNSKFNLLINNEFFSNTSELHFESELYRNSLSMKLNVDSNHFIEYIYTINEDYIIDFEINLAGMNNIIPTNVNYINFEWQMSTPKTEKSKSNQDMYTGVYYQHFSDNEVDYLSLTKDDNDEITSKLKWVAFKQQFFSSILISSEGFQKPTLLKSNPKEDEYIIKDLYAKFEIPFNHQQEEKTSLKFYFGPNHYNTLKEYDSKFEELIPLGWGIFGWVNKYIIINLFDLLSKYFSNYGVIILLLTIIIKLALSPFTYKAFLSQAKMKVLKPEIDKITDKQKGKDPMKTQQETMNLYRKAGVNPMGGCLPMLFQFPILIAMFRFFPASIELRQQSFLWADDLSTYDSIYELGFNIPFYGDHISLFTLLMTISTLLYTHMNSSMATGQMAQMKWMMYLMPIMFLGFFNNYAAGLSYYYFLANMFTFGQQAIMKKTINENALLAQIEENKKKPRKKSKFQKKLEEMQKKQEAKMRKR